MSNSIENAITVGELRDMLAEYSDSAIVVLSPDADGNSFSPLETVEAGEYTPVNAIHGDFVPTDDEDAVCLYPAA